MTSSARRRLFLLDGYALAYRAFYALIGRPLRSSRGENTSVPWGVTQLIRKLLAEQRPDYLGLVLDAPGGATFRRELFGAYKATRDKLDEVEEGDFERSMRRVRQLLDALRIPVIEVEGYEADDVIGSLARLAVRRGLEAVIVSGDTDFYQLIRPRLSVLEPGRRGRAMIEPQWMDERAATERLGVPPGLVVDFLALTGDPSDNVPGVRGIGPKTAAALLQRWGSLDEILAHVPEVEPRRARQALEDEAKAALLSRELVTIRTDVPVRLDLGALAVREPDRGRIRDLFLELEFHSLLHDLAPARVEQARYELVTTVERLEEITRRAARRGRVAIEPVLTPGWPGGARLAGIGLCSEPGKAYYAPLGHAGNATGGLAAAGPGPLSRMLASPEVGKVGHDLKRGLLALRRAGIELAGTRFDTMLAAYTIDPSRRQYDLEAAVVERFGHRLQDTPEGAPVWELPPERVASFAAERADMALRLADQLAGDLDAYGQRRLFERIELPLVAVLADMEWAGIRIDRRVFTDLSQRLGRDLARLRRITLAEAGEEINLDSPSQLRQVLFERLGLPVVKRTKTGPSTDADVLAELAARGYSLPRYLLDYRQLAKLKSTYADTLPAHADPETHRIHTTFNQAVTATGRLSSSDPNLQNIPVQTDLGATLRRGFVAAPDHLLLAADYSQIELRIAAHLSREPAFIAAFRAGADVHRETAARVFDVPVARVTDAMRGVAKVVNFATLYGQRAPSLARMLGISLEEAQSFIDGYFSRFAAVRALRDRQIRLARERGWVETLLGRRRYVPELHSRDPRLRGFGERVAQNSPIQGSAADLIKMAMIRIHADLHARGLEARMLLQVHDELLFELPAAELPVVQKLVREEMEGVVALRVPLVVDLGIGESWYAAKTSRLERS